MKLRSITPELVPAVLDLWTRRWGTRFPLDRDLWRQNTDCDAAHFDPKRCWVIEGEDGVEGCLSLKAPAHPPAWPGQHPAEGWISFLLLAPGRERDLASPLIETALAYLRRAGHARVIYGGDPAHFFPGAPVEDLALCTALEDAGFRPEEPVHDVIGYLRDFRVPAGVENTLRRESADVRPCDRGDVPELYGFLDRHFPGRWAYETRRRLDIEPQLSDVLLLMRNAEVVGFCHIYHVGSGRIGPSIYWRRAIGERYGGLGPIGLARDVRGRGLGSALLVLALHHLRGFGVERAVIDWTTLTDFYARHGFEVWRTYRPWRRAL